MPASRLQRLQLPQQRGSRALETTEPRILAKKSAQALDAGGGREVKIGATTNLDRLQVHRKWEISAEHSADGCVLALRSRRIMIDSGNSGHNAYLVADGVSIG